MARTGTQRGFTLLEVMLVVVLIGIAVTFVNLRLDPDPERVVKRESGRVVALLLQLMDESVLRARVMALSVDESTQRYGFEVLAGGEWKSLDRDELFYARRFAPPVTASLRVDDERVEDSGEDGDVRNGDSSADRRARIVVDPVGGITDFALALQAGGHQVVVTLDEFAQVISRPVEVAR